MRVPPEPKELMAAGSRNSCAPVLLSGIHLRSENLRERERSKVLTQNKEIGGMALSGDETVRDRAEDWVIVYGQKDGVEGYALRELNRLVQKNAPRPVRVEEDRRVTDEIREHNLVVVGTEGSNHLISEFLESGLLRVERSSPEWLTIRITDNPYHSGKQMIVLTGSDGNGVLYAVRDFEHYVFDRATKVNSAGRCYHLPFQGRFDEVTLVGAPAIRYRGLWTWGHAIYDWRRYLDNMSRWKMNAVIIWNDFAPVNSEEIVSYAHERGIRVIWGYSWGWGEEVDPTSHEELEKWAGRVVEKYESEYRETGCDGIYFQIFTETTDTEIKGHSIAKLAVKWVNGIAQRLLERYPDLWILFGVHATSIKDNYQVLAGVDERLSIIWEDIGLPKPQFPYAYDPDVVADYGSAVSYTSKVARLRGDKEDVGIVVKGMTNLDWETFEHQPGRFILGESDPEFVARRTQDKVPRWRYVEMEWRKNLICLVETVNAVTAASPARSSVFGLVEDGLWEERMWLPVALLAEVAWNPNVAPEELVRKVAATDDAYKLV